MKKTIFNLMAMLVIASTVVLGESDLRKVKDLLDQRKSAEAIEVCQSYLKSNSRDEDGWLLLAKAYQQALNLDEAEKAAKRAVELDDELWEAYTVLAQVQLSKKRWLDAYTTAKTGLKLMGSSQPRYAPLLIELAWSLIAADSANAALVVASEARELEPNNPVAYELIGLAYLHEKPSQPYMAEINLNKSLELNPNQPKVLFDLAEAYAKDRKYTEAAQTYIRIIEMDSTNCAARLELATLLFRARQREAKCVSVLEEYFDKCPSKDKKVKEMYIKALLRCNRYNEAVKVAEDLKKIDPNSPLVLRAFANQYYSTGQYSKSIEFFIKLKEVDTLEYDDYRLLGYAYSKIKNDAMAAKTWEEIVKDTTETAETRSRFLQEIGSAWMRARSYEEAADAFKRRIQIDPSAVSAVINHALCMIQLGKFEEAVSSLKQAKAKNPNYPPIYNNLGYVYFQMKDYEGGRREYETSIKIIDTAEFKYRYELADAYRMIGLAIMMRKEIDPEASRKKWESAIVYLKKSLRYYEPVSQTYYLLGKCHQNLGNIDEAIKAYKRVLQLDPKNKEVPGLISELEKYK